MNKKIVYAIVAIVVVLVVSYFSIKYKEGAVVAARAQQNNKGLPDTSKKSNEPSCFSGDSVIYLENGKTKQIQDAKLGDKILSYNLNKNEYKYSPIIAIPHEKNSQLDNFIELKTSGNKTIKMTEKHLLPVLQKSSRSFKLLTADKIEIGDTVISKDGNETVELLKNVELEGVYTVVTLDEYVVVDNIVASPFFENFHIAGNIYYSVFRALYNANPDIIKSNMYEKFNDSSHALYLHVHKNIISMVSQ